MEKFTGFSGLFELACGIFKVKVKNLFLGLFFERQDEWGKNLSLNLKKNSQPTRFYFRSLYFSHVDGISFCMFLHVSFCKSEILNSRSMFLINGYIFVKKQLYFELLYSRDYYLGNEIEDLDGSSVCTVASECEGPGFDPPIDSIN